LRAASLLRAHLKLRKVINWKCCCVDGDKVREALRKKNCKIRQGCSTIGLPYFDVISRSQVREKKALGASRFVSR
jgi:hypothetical protein